MGTNRSFKKLEYERLKSHTHCTHPLFTRGVGVEGPSVLIILYICVLRRHMPLVHLCPISQGCRIIFLLL